MFNIKAKGHEGHLHYMTQHINVLHKAGGYRQLWGTGHCRHVPLGFQFNFFS